MAVLIIALFLFSSCNIPTNNNSRGDTMSPGEGIAYDRLSLYPNIFPDEDFKMGYIDDKGNITIEPVFAIANDFENNFALVAAPDDVLAHWYFINKAGENIFGETFERAADFSEGRAVVSKNGHTYVINTKGERVVEINSNAVFPGKFQNGLLLIPGELQNDFTRTYEYVNHEGHIVCSGVYSYANNFSEELASVQNPEDGKLYYIDKTGKIVIRTEFSFEVVELDMHRFSDGLALVDENQDDGTIFYGYIDRNGEIAIPLQYQYAQPFSEGLAMVQTGEGTGFINTSGEMVIPPVYEDAKSFSEGLACVTKAENEFGPKRAGFINRQGELVIDYLYSDFYSAAVSYEPANIMKNGLIQVKSYDEGWYGYIDKHGTRIF